MVDDAIYKIHLADNAAAFQLFEGGDRYICLGMPRYRYGQFHAVFVLTTRHTLRSMNQEWAPVLRPPLTVLDRLKASHDEVSPRLSKMLRAFMTGPTGERKYGYP